MSMALNDLEITEADYHNPEHGRAIIELLDAYSRDPMGQEAPLPESVRQHLIPGLKNTPGSFLYLAFVEGKPAGIITCFTGFSTFKARKLVNIHDIAVMPEFRGMGIGQKLIEAAEKRAVSLGCCKLTLEVRDDNRAKHLYKRCGFEAGEPEMLFWTKEL